MRQRNRHYVGVFGIRAAEVFHSLHVPTRRDELPYVYVIGPFETIAGADRMRRAIAEGATHLILTVADAERYARAGR